MFYNRMDIFNITLLQLISKLVKVIFLKIVTIFLWRNFSDSYAVLVLYIITQIKEIFKLLWAIGSIWHYGGCLNKRAARLRLAVQAPAIWKDGAGGTQSARERAVAAEPLGGPPLSPVRRYLSGDALYAVFVTYRRLVDFHIRRSIPTVTVLIRKSVPSHTRATRR